jgi:hypothetical protein
MAYYKAVFDLQESSAVIYDGNDSQAVLAHGEIEATTSKISNFKQRMSLGSTVTGFRSNNVRIINDESGGGVRHVSQFMLYSDNTSPIPRKLEISFCLFRHTSTSSWECTPQTLGIDFGGNQIPVKIIIGQDGSQTFIWDKVN